MQRQITDILALAAGLGLALLMVLAASPVRAVERQSLEALAARTEAFAGTPVRIDPRLILPDCAAPSFDWTVQGRSVAIACAAPVWRINVPVEGGRAVTAPIALEPPAIRRGDRVMVEAGGPGFSVAIEAIAEADAAQGRVRLRNGLSGARLTGQLTHSGQVVLTGLSPVVNGR